MVVRALRRSPWHGASAPGSLGDVCDERTTGPAWQAVGLGYLCFQVSGSSTGYSPGSDPRLPGSRMGTWGAETGNSKAGLHSFIQPTCMRLPGQAGGADRWGGHLVFPLKLGVCLHGLPASTAASSAPHKTETTELGGEAGLVLGESLLCGTQSWVCVAIVTCSDIMASVDEQVGSHMWTQGSTCPHQGHEQEMKTSESVPCLSCTRQAYFHFWAVGPTFCWTAAVLHWLWALLPPSWSNKAWWQPSPVP